MDDIFVSLALPVLVLIFGCSFSQLQGTRRIDDLIGAHQSPVEVVSARRDMNPMAPTFSVRLKNISDAEVFGIIWTAVFYDDDDKLLPKARTEVSYGHLLKKIRPGETGQLAFTAKDDSAIKVKLVIKRLFYMKRNPLGEDAPSTTLMWTNLKYAAELKAAEDQQPGRAADAAKVARRPQRAQRKRKRSSND